MIDLRRNVITTYTAEVDDFVAGSKKMASAVKDTAKAEDDAGKAREKHGQGAVDWLGKMGAAYAGFSKLASDAMNMARDSAERMRLETAAGSINIDKLSAAAGGLLTRTEQLTIASQLQHGAFKLGEDQMVTVEKAMRELTREGFKQEDVIKKVTDAVVKLEGDGLKDFGIRLGKTGSDAEAFTQIMDKLAGKADLVGDGTKTAGESMTAAGVSMTDSIDKIKDALGRLVVALSPLLQALADAVGLIADLADPKKHPVSGSNNQGSWHNVSWEVVDWIGQNIYQGDPGVLADKLLDARQYTATPSHKLVESTQQLEMAMPTMDMRRKKGGVGGDDGAIHVIIDNAPTWRSDGSIASVTDGTSRAGDYGNIPTTPAGGYAVEDVEGLASSYANIGDAKGAPSFLEGVFGSLDEFDTYRGAFEALGGAVGASLGAMIDGSGSAAQAFKHFIADTLKSLAISNTVKAITETAEGFASLASGNAISAGAHFTSAAKFGIAAAAAGGSAAILGTTAGDANAARGSAGAQGGSAGGSRGSAGGSSGGGDNRPIVIVTGNDMADQTPRMRQVNAQRYVELAIGRAGYGTSDR